MGCCCDEEEVLLPPPVFFLRRGENLLVEEGDWCSAAWLLLFFRLERWEEDLAGMFSMVEIVATSTSLPEAGPEAEGLLLLLGMMLGGRGGGKPETCPWNWVCAGMGGGPTGTVWWPETNVPSGIDTGVIG